MSHPRPPFSARQLAEQVLAFREANAPDKHRFSEHALIVDNGRRGSEQKAVIFTGDDLSALLMDLRVMEQVNTALSQRLTVTINEALAWFNTSIANGLVHPEVTLRHGDTLAAEVLRLRADLAARDARWEALKERIKTFVESPHDEEFLAEMRSLESGEKEQR